MAGWVTLWLAGISIVGVLVHYYVLFLLPVPWLATVIAIAFVVALSAWGARLLTRRWSAMSIALTDAISSLRDHDFSMSVTRATDDEMGALVAAYNGLGERLRVERQSLYQRELMLDTVIQSTPLALVLTNLADHVLYSNSSARQLFG